jgi:hypothetical protein
MRTIAVWINSRSPRGDIYVTDYTVCYIASKGHLFKLSLAEGQYSRGTVARMAKALAITTQMEREIIAFWDPVPEVLSYEFMRAVMTFWIKVAVCGR